MSFDSRTFPSWMIADLGQAPSFGCPGTKSPGGDLHCHRAFTVTNLPLTPKHRSLAGEATTPGCTDNISARLHTSSVVATHGFQFPKSIPVNTSVYLTSIWSCLRSNCLEAFGLHFQCNTQSIQRQLTSGLTLNRPTQMLLETAMNLIERANASLLSLPDLAKRQQCSVLV
ncbi:MAG: hypothetical protein AAGL98_01675, partial [Planctomycetota bacterium]